MAASKTTAAQPCAPNGNKARSEGNSSVSTASCFATCGIKRKYFAGLAGATDQLQKTHQVGGDAREAAKDTEAAVRFSLDQLLEFQQKMRDFRMLKEEHDPPRKRPNYNNTKRAFSAKGRPPNHQESLD